MNSLTDKYRVLEVEENTTTKEAFSVTILILKAEELDINYLYWGYYTKRLSHLPMGFNAAN